LVKDDGGSRAVAQELEEGERIIFRKGDK